MKKLQVFGVSFLILIFLVSLSSAIRINEVELNPEGTDSGKEWIELYSENEVSISGFAIKNNDNKIINLTKLLGNLSFSGFLIVNFTSQFLDNSDEKVFLLNNNIIIDETYIFDDNYNDGRSWQFCGNWSFANSTLRKENLCLQQNQTNQTQQNQINQTQNQTADIFLKLEYDKEVKNGEEFEVEIKAYNLGNKKYDIKVFVSFDNDTIISETYDENESKWKSSNYYVNEIFVSGGNNSENLKLRIDESYGNFSGDAKIKVRIRESNSSSYIAEFENNIEILEKEVTNESIGNNEEEEVKNEKQNIEENVIQLNAPKDIKSSNVKEYKSKTQYIKEYAIYGFALFCVFVIILLLKKKL